MTASSSPMTASRMVSISALESAIRASYSPGFTGHGTGGTTEGD